MISILSSNHFKNNVQKGIVIFKYNTGRDEVTIPREGFLNDTGKQEEITIEISIVSCINA